MEEAVKYTYVHKVYRSQIVKEMIKKDKWYLTKAGKIWIAEAHFNNIKSGKLYDNGADRKSGQRFW